MRKKNNYWSQTSENRDKKRRNRVFFEAEDGGVYTVIAKLLNRLASPIGSLYSAPSLPGWKRCKKEERGGRQRDKEVTKDNSGIDEASLVAAFAGSAGPQQKETDRQKGWWPVCGIGHNAHGVLILIGFVSCPSQPNELMKTEENIIQLLQQNKLRLYKSVKIKKKVCLKTTDPWNECRRPTLTHKVDKPSCMRAQTSTHTHVNQYAEPEPLHSLITASLPLPLLASMLLLFLFPALKCPEKWVCEDRNLFKCNRKAARAIRQ